MVLHALMLGWSPSGDTDTPLILYTNNMHIWIMILMSIMIYVSMPIMIKRITANLPQELLREAMEVSGKGITGTIVEGLRRVRQGRAFGKAQALRGRISLDINLEESRERSHR
jgi:hypothetical protein